MIKLERTASNNPSEMWNNLKRLCNPPSIKATLEFVREDGSITNDINEVLQRWLNDISGLFSGLKQNPEFAFDDKFYNEIVAKKHEFENFIPESQLENNSGYRFTDNLNSDILFQEVSDAIDSAQNGKSFLLIPNEAMKNNNAKLLLHKLFQNCLSSGLSPTEWDSSSIKPIPKKDSDGRDPLQNRCITIICCVSKIYAKILNKRLQKYLELNNILVDEQNGFRASRSCIDHILVLCTILRNRKSVGLDTFLAFIDFKKAFDSVDRSLLLFKLSEIGIRGNFYKAISSMNSNPRSRVILNNEYATDYFDCPIGVKQGCCLSPTLFSIFLNDLAVEIKESGIFLELNNILMESSKAANQTLSSSILFINIFLYADDIVLIAKNVNDLQDLLFIVEHWCLKWRLEVNLAKTNIMHVRSARKSQSNYFFLFNRRPVPY